VVRSRCVKLFKFLDDLPVFYEITYRQACLACGIGVSTLSRWRKEQPELEPQLAQARETARLKALDSIRAAGEAGDWRASVAFLKLSFPEYRQPSTKVDVNANAQAATVVITEEKRRELQERFRRLMERSDTPTDR
jgi:hypothetical protein